MKNITIVILALVLGYTAVGQSSFYNLEAEAITGEIVKFKDFKGKKVMIVNTASKCAYTNQYADLEALYQKYGGEDFVIIGFPANNFMNQEPGTDEEIIQFCTSEFGVSFLMMSKISVKGKDQHPVYQWLTCKDKNGVMDSNVKWNFQKYLIDDKGNLVDYIKTKVNPFDETIIEFITN